MNGVTINHSVTNDLVKTHITINQEKHTYSSEYFNFHLLVNTAQKLLNHPYYIILGSTKGFASPPVTREELKGLADFIYQVLENDSNQNNKS